MAFDEAIATLTLYCEASNCSGEEQIAVAHVLNNRKGRWQPTVAGVCLQRMQFSEWNADPIDNKNLLRAANTPDTDPVLKQCKAAFNVSLLMPDSTDGATHYHDKSINPPSWTVGATKTLETEHFIFYKDVK